MEFDNYFSADFVFLCDRTDEYYEQFYFDEVQNFRQRLLKEPFNYTNPGVLVDYIKETWQKVKQHEEFNPHKMLIEMQARYEKELKE